MLFNWDFPVKHEINNNNNNNNNNNTSVSDDINEIDGFFAPRA
jgi:hypothetical protein